MKTRLHVALAACLALVLAGASVARSQTSATITPSLSPDHLGARAALTLATRFTAPSAGGVPQPVRKVLLRLPNGLTLDIPKLRSCSAGILSVRGASACPAASRLGGGKALAEEMLPSQLVTEDVALSAFLGPLDDQGEPTFLMLAQGTTPFVEQMMFSGTAQPDKAPYGERLTMTIPSVQTIPLGPEASLASLSVTIGSPSGQRERHANAVLVPGRCPRGGFPFAAQFVYADGSRGEARAAAPCPGRHRRPSRARNRARGTIGVATGRARSAARAVRLSETARLRLTSRKGFTLNERGSVTGTIAGTIYVHLRIVSSSRVAAEVNIYRPGGSITAHASAAYRRGARQGTFAGSLSIDRGTGAYAAAKGAGLAFSGTIQRSSYAIAVHVGGRASL
jgi:hypothetical protein